MSEQPLEHWPTERMINEGHPTTALSEDLEGLSDEELMKIAGICAVPEFAPDECIPCLANVMFLERQRQRLEDMAPDMTDEDEPDTPKLDDLMDEADTFTPPEMKPVAEQFAEKVEELNDLVRELLNGPPIPPPNVTLGELALLVLASDRYVKMTESQGLELSPNQQAVLDSTKALVARLRT